MITSRMLPSSQVNQWVTNAEKKIDLPSRGGPGDGWILHINDPLSSLSTLTPGGTGTWSIDAGVLKATCLVNSQMRLVHQTYMPTSPSAYLVQVEVEMPSNFSGGNDHIGIGFQNGTVDTSGRWVGIFRSDPVVGFLQDAIGWGTLNTYTPPAAGTWFKYRLFWNDLTNQMGVYINGVQIASQVLDMPFTAGQTKPMLMWYNSAIADCRFRNLKAWYQSGTTVPALPA